MTAGPQQEVAYAVVEARTDTQRMWVDQYGVLHASPDPGVHISAADARAAVDLGWELKEHHICSVIVDLRHIRSMDRDARAYYAGPEVTARTFGAALLVGNPLTRAVGNLFLGLNKAAHPLRLFPDDFSAVAWCRTLG
ncbi:MAG: hypothetical protein V4850_14540 [Myxococcota bacterium]